MNFTGKSFDKGIDEVKSLQDKNLKMMTDYNKIDTANDDVNLTISEIFPWISDFKQMCKCLLTDRSVTCLTKLMQHYLRCVNVSANKCYGNPSLTMKLKNSINETLLLFMFIYREISDDYHRYAYLNNMSDLLAVYIDLELKASRKNKEDHRKLTARLTSCLYVYLEHSIEHLLDTLIKIQFMCRSYHRILDPIITKILKDIPSHPKTNEMYIRYLLIYRLWRKINTDQAVKNQITATAISSLGEPPLAYPPCLLEDLLPKVPKSQADAAKYLLQQKFNIRKSCELFVQFCRENKTSHVGKNNEDQTMGSNSSKHEDNSSPKTITERVNNKMNGGLISNNLNSNSVRNISDKDSTSIRKKVFKKSKDILFIDLTFDVPVEKIFKKKQCKKLAWLEEAKKKRSRRESTMKKHQHVEDVNSNSGICTVASLSNETIEESTNEEIIVDGPVIENDSNTSSMEDKQSIIQEMNKLNISEKAIGMEDEVIYCSISNGDRCDIQAELEIDSSEKDGEEMEADSSDPCPMNLSISHSVDNNSKDTYMIHDSEFQEDNIDGLSLLASVSQRVPHLKAESKLKVKDYSILKEEGFCDVQDVTEIFANPTTDMINRIVGVYPDDKVASNVEVTSSNEQDMNNFNGANKPSDPFFNSQLDENIVINSDNSTANESNTQMVKDNNTNVILNGETIVLLQKSPNSNLYIINKAKESNSGDEDTNIDFDFANYQGNEYVKLEPDDSIESKSYVKLNSSSNDNLIPLTQNVYQDNSTTDRRNNMIKTNVNIMKNLKHELRNLNPQHTLHNGLSSVCNNCPASAELCVPCRKRCNPVTCSLQMNSGCSCLKCTYDIMTTHCRQCIYPASDTHLPCIENNSYYQSSHSSVQSSTVQEHDRTNNDSVIAQLYDDQLICQIEKNYLHNEQLINKDSENILTHVNNKLPLKKRIRTMVYDKMPRKKEELNNYPNVPMMSIAALEAIDNQKQTINLNMRKFDHRIINKDREVNCEQTSTGSDNNGRKVDMIKRTRSSQRKVPKVNYSYPEIDPDLVSSGESKRKRRKTRR